MKNCPISGPFLVQKEPFWGKNAVKFQILGVRITYLHLKDLMHLSYQVFGASPVLIDCLTLAYVCVFIWRVV